jgi:hypothetical protein
MGVPITPALFDAICAELTAGKSLTAICAALGVDRTTVMRHASKDAEVLKRVHQSRVAGTDAVMDDIRDFADTELDPHRARVALDALKFYVVKMNPEKYGDKIDMNIRGKLDMGAILIAADKRLAALPSRAPVQLPSVNSPSVAESDSE